MFISKSILCPGAKVKSSTSIGFTATPSIVIILLFFKLDPNFKTRALEAFMNLNLAILFSLIEYCGDFFPFIVSQLPILPA